MELNNLLLNNQNCIVKNLQVKGHMGRLVRPTVHDLNGLLHSQKSHAEAVKPHTAFYTHSISYALCTSIRLLCTYQL